VSVVCCGRRSLNGVVVVWRENPPFRKVKPPKHTIKPVLFD